MQLGGTAAENHAAAMRIKVRVQQEQSDQKNHSTSVEAACTEPASDLTKPAHNTVQNLHTVLRCSCAIYACIQKSSIINNDDIRLIQCNPP